MLQECHDVLNEDICFGPMKTSALGDDIPSFIEVSERVSKTRQGHKNTHKREMQPCLWPSEDPDICPVRAFVEYRDRKSLVLKDPKKQFLLTPKQAAVKDPSAHSVWYINSNMGVHRCLLLKLNDFYSILMTAKPMLTLVT